MSKYTYIINKQTERELNVKIKMVQKLERDLLNFNSKFLEQSLKKKRFDKIVYDAEVKKIYSKYDIDVSKVGLKELIEEQEKRVKFLNGSTNKNVQVFTGEKLTELQETFEGQLNFTTTANEQKIRYYINQYDEKIYTLKQDFVQNGKSLEEAQKIAEELSKKAVARDFVQDDEIVKFVRSNGSKERFEYWLDRNVRYANTEQHLADVRLEANLVGNDLVRVSAHADCSDICLPYQGNVFSISGDSKKYPSFQSAIDGGLYHFNCRHYTSHYFPGISDENLFDDVTDLKDKTILNRYDNRQKQKQYKRKAKEFDDKYVKAKNLGLDDEAKAFRKKRIFYNKLAT